MKAFISYRRDDSLDFAGRLSDRLAVHFGAGAIFRDIDAIPLGADFVEVIAQEINQCDAFLVIIGPSWLGPRLADPSDFVRLEIESALAGGVPVVPVLVGNTRMPAGGDLPPSLSGLSLRQAVAVRSGSDFHRDVDVLIRALESLTSKVRTQTQQAPDVDPSDLKSNFVFVSHATANRKWVEREVIRYLEIEGIRTWYAKTSIGTSAQWEREILRGMEKCDWFLLVVSQKAADSEWVKDELFWAIQNRPTRIVPIIMEKCDLYQFHIRLPRIQHIDFTMETRVARRILIDSLLGGGSRTV
ncbi:MAG TPA: toll/interleukin-1 receptor domain-containing protein [Polyangiaceae bacterium]|nr:toll/interleukin-1 receptor domain-containing protein [Polyangiaceae bacterium]